MGNPLVAVTSGLTIPGGVEATFSLTDGSVLVQSSDSIHRWHPSRALERDLVPVSEVGTLRGAAYVGNALYLAGPTGVVGYAAEGLYQPPLHTALSEEEILAFGRPMEDEGIWIVTPSGVYRWSAGTLVVVAIPGTRLEDVQLSFGPAPESGTTRVYLRDSATIFQIDAQGDDVAVTRLVAAPPAQDMDVDGDGAIWVCSTDGHLHRGDTLGYWHQVREVEAVDRVRVSRGGEALWVRGEGAMYYGEGRSLHRWEFADVPSAYAVAEGGVLLGNLEDGGFRASSRHRVWLRTLSDGEEVFASRRVTVVTEAPDAVESLSIRHAGASVEVDLERPAFDIDIDPEMPLAGRFAVEIAAEFSDGTLPVDLQLTYIVPGESPRWEGDIAVISATYCEDCHGAENAMAGARPFETRDQWIDAFDQIEYNVVSGNMPKAPREPLPAELVRRIVAWSLTGFSE